MVIKLDMEIIFDRVHHSYIFDVMKKPKFEEVFIKWIEACIGGPWITTLINGFPCNFFQASKGLRQGGPLSPLLYNIVVETFSINVDLAKLEGKLKALSIPPNTKYVNHSQFVDDTLFIGRTSRKTSKRLKNSLSLYLNLFGGLVNKGKS